MKFKLLLLALVILVFAAYTYVAHKKATSIDRKEVFTSEALTRDYEAKITYDGEGNYEVIVKEGKDD